MLAYSALLAQLSLGVEPLSSREAAKHADSELDSGPTVAELCLNFLRHAEQHYVKDGRQTSEVHVVRSVIRPLRELYGLTPAKDFGPLALKAVRAKMIDLGWSRTTINAAVCRIRRIFRHAVENEQIDVTTYQRLQALTPLLKGKTAAPEKIKRSAVPQERIDRVCELVSPLVKDLIDLQLCSGTRPGELLTLNSLMIDRSKPVWRTVTSRTSHVCHWLCQC